MGDFILDRFHPNTHYGKGTEGASSVEMKPDMILFLLLFSLPLAIKLQCCKLIKLRKFNPVLLKLRESIEMTWMVVRNTVSSIPETRIWGGPWCQLRTQNSQGRMKFLLFGGHLGKHYFHL